MSAAQLSLFLSRLSALIQHSLQAVHIICLYLPLPSSFSTTGIHNTYYNTYRERERVKKKKEKNVKKGGVGVKGDVLKNKKATKGAHTTSKSNFNRLENRLYTV